MRCKLVPHSTRKREYVLVYFANETHLTPEARRNYARIIAKLRTDRVGNGREVALQLVSDLHRFPAAVCDEIEILTRLAKCSSTVKMLVFTNELSHRQKALLVRNGAAMEIDFNHTAPLDYILESSPNSYLGTLVAGLALAERAFSPTTNTFTLIIKSHASDRHVITPRLTIHSERTDPNEILEIANGRPASKDKSEHTSSIGVSSADFLEAIAMTKTRTSLFFDHVFLEVCAGRAVFSDAHQLPANVGTLTVPSKGLEYKNIDYNALISSKVPIRSLQAQIKALFPSETVQTERKYLFELIIWWLPLATLIASWIIFYF